MTRAKLIKRYSSDTCCEMCGPFSNIDLSESGDVQLFSFSQPNS